MTILAITEPMGVASEGMARRAPALDADSNRTTWKKRRGTMNKNCRYVATGVKRMPNALWLLPHRRRTRHTHSIWPFNMQREIVGMADGCQFRTPTNT